MCWIILSLHTSIVFSSLERVTGHCLTLPTSNLVGFWEWGARFLGVLLPSLIPRPSPVWSHPEAHNCFLQPAQGTVLLLFHLSISSEFSPRARQTCRVCYQDSLSWVLAPLAQIPIHSAEERHHCGQRVYLCISLSNSGASARSRYLTLLMSHIFYRHTLYMYYSIFQHLRDLFVMATSCHLLLQEIPCTMLATVAIELPDNKLNIVLLFMKCRSLMIQYHCAFCPRAACT